MSSLIEVLFAFFWVIPRRLKFVSPANPYSSCLPHTSDLNVAGETFTACFSSLTRPPYSVPPYSVPSPRPNSSDHFQAKPFPV